MGLLKDVLLNSLPKPVRLPVWYYVKKFTGMLDPEIQYLSSRVPRDKMMVDIGANIGIYSYAFSRYCPSVAAFEPLPSCNVVLSSFASPRIEVFPIALSNKPGTMVLNVPVKNGSPLTGLASFRKLEGECLSHTVEVSTLDSFNFKNIGFIKIDVEGHESEVLEGSIKTIRSERPILLIEMEQNFTRSPLEQTFKLLQDEGYKGGFLLEGKYHPIEEFSCQTHQEQYAEDLFLGNYSKIRGKYVCNFIFESIV